MIVINDTICGWTGKFDTFLFCYNLKYGQTHIPQKLFDAEPGNCSRLQSAR